MTEEEIEKKAHEYAFNNYTDVEKAVVYGANLILSELTEKDKTIKNLQHNKRTIVDLNNTLVEHLEKKVEYYEQQLSAMEKGVCDVCKVKDAGYYENQIADLEKENKEYESEARECNIRLDEMVKRYIPRLVQAKKIITLCRDTFKENGYDFTKAYKQAEQFIKEEMI